MVDDAEHVRQDPDKAGDGRLYEVIAELRFTQTVADNRDCGGAVTTLLDGIHGDLEQLACFTLRLGDGATLRSHMQYSVNVMIFKQSV